MQEKLERFDLCRWVGLEIRFPGPNFNFKELEREYEEWWNHWLAFSTCRFRYLPSHTVSKGPKQIRSNQVRDASRQKRNSLFPPSGTHGVHHPYRQWGFKHGNSRVGERYSSYTYYEWKQNNKPLRWFVRSFHVPEHRSNNILFIKCNGPYLYTAV